MKKTNKQKKIIVTIAIIVTTNIINNNDKVANEGYFATTANANSNLVASYIKEGITIGGITGTLEVLDTSDADATAEDISWGKTGYVNGIKITGTRIDTVAQAKESQQTFSENKILQDDYGNSVKVPAGFKIAEDSATSVTGGVVIEDVSAPGKTSDTKGSQFVWIPVGDVITDSNGNTTEIKLGRYDFSSDGTPSEYSGSYSEDTANNHDSSYVNVIAKDIEDFKTKASEGYYIGRYEAGDALATNSERTGVVDVSNPNNPITCKARVYPYTYVDQADASMLCQNMYKSNDFESDLINSYAWDTAIVFIQTFSGDTDYSRQTKLQKSLAKCGESTDGTNKDVRCNIYDMSGNTIEWTTETGSSTSYPCSNRGGYNSRLNFDYTSFRSSSIMSHCNNVMSFRVTLYL